MKMLERLRMRNSDAKLLGNPCDVRRNKVGPALYILVPVTFDKVYMYILYPLKEFNIILSYV